MVLSGSNGLGTPQPCGKFFVPTHPVTQPEKREVGNNEEELNGKEAGDSDNIYTPSTGNELENMVDKSDANSSGKQPVGVAKEDDVCSLCSDITSDIDPFDEIFWACGKTR